MHGFMRIKSGKNNNNNNNYEKKEYKDGTALTFFRELNVMKVIVILI